jgi:hypothetical protein
MPENFCFSHDVRNAHHLDKLCMNHASNEATCEAKKKAGNEVWRPLEHIWSGVLGRQQQNLIDSRTLNAPTTKAKEARPSAIRVSLLCPDCPMLLQRARQAKHLLNDESPQPAQVIARAPNSPRHQIPQGIHTLSGDRFDPQQNLKADVTTATSYHCGIYPAKK